MKIIRQELGQNIALIQLEGRLDATSNIEVREVLRKLLRVENPKLVIDLKQVPFIDSSGLAALVSGLRLAREQGGNITLSGVQPQAQTVFRLTMLDRIFSVHPTPEEAKQSLL